MRRIRENAAGASLSAGCIFVGAGMHGIRLGIQWRPEEKREK
jgi:hypothetical protein